mmetsp:Transcript_21621/g.60111  ORF Transcript_21621/g.60111 Transcript_21621/m.60111 type:complete len:120 (+) Transcript_21621:741-1100(+)
MRRNETKRDETKRDQTRRNETRPDPTRPDQTHLITHAFLGLGVRCDPSATPGQWGKVLKSEIEEKSSNDWKAPRDVHVGRNVLLVFIATAAIVSVSSGSMFDGDTIGLFIVLDALLLPG